MKKLLSICIFTLLTTSVIAQVSKTINVITAGTLTSLLTSTDKTTTTDLTVTGNIDATDVKCMRNEMTVLANLDISNVIILAYEGNGGTSSSTSYPANSLPEYSFYNTYTSVGKISLKSVILPNTITSIGYFSFRKCSGLANVIIGNSVSTIERYAFIDCSNLIQINIPNSLISIEDSAFDSCSKLTSINFGNSLLKIGSYAFNGCYQLSGNLVIPNSVTQIGSMAFPGCSKLTSLTIGSSVSSIGPSAFSYCNGLKTIYVLNETPPVLGISCFSNVSSVTAVYVPSVALSLYKSAPGWSDSFMSIIIASDVYSLTVNIGIGGIVKEDNVTLANGSIVSSTPNSLKIFTIIPNDGYEINTVTYGGIDVKSQLIENKFTTPAVTENKILNVTFKKIQYILSLKSAESGTMDLLCEYGATASIKLSPAVGWRINSVIYNGLDVTNSLLNGIYTVPAITTNSHLNVSFVSSSTGAPVLINSQVKVYCTKFEIIVDGTSEGETVTIYTLNGKQIQTIMSKGERLSIPVDRDTVYLVKTGEKTFKVIL